MCELFDQYFRQGRKEGSEARLLSNIRALMENLSFTAEQAMKALNVPAGEQAEYLARL